MKYLMLVCSDGVATAEKTAAMQQYLSGWVEEMEGRGVRLVGKQLDYPRTAKTVRVRNGETLISDGPFVESKEFIAGFDIIDCENLDEAIAVAARHPVSWFHAIELRPFTDESGADGAARSEPIPESLEPSVMRHLLMVCRDGIARAPEVEAGIRRDAGAWRQRVKATGEYVFGYPLEHQDTATTVRVRDGETLLTDGPVTEADEFLGGIAVLSCASAERAIELAAQHPLARLHMVEVRAFMDP